MIPPSVISPDAVMLPAPPTPSVVVPEVTKPVTLIVPAGAARVSVLVVSAGVTASLPPVLVSEMERELEIVPGVPTGPARMVRSPFVETLSVLADWMLLKVRLPEPVIVIPCAITLMLPPAVTVPAEERPLPVPI